MNSVSSSWIGSYLGLRKSYRIRIIWTTMGLRDPPQSLLSLSSHFFFCPPLPWCRVPPRHDFNFTDAFLQFNYFTRFTISPTRHPLIVPPSLSSFLLIEKKDRKTNFNRLLSWYNVNWLKIEILIIFIH